jgi:tetratricopeptide (TPR) repeat protein
VAGNRRAYDAAMKRAADLAWDRKWSRAIEEYGRALGEFPQDVTALTGLGLAYVETRQLEKALDTYRQAANRAADNPEVIRRVGYVYERLAKLKDAARAYVLAGEAAARMRDVSQAIEMWKKASILAPGSLGAHRNLASMYRNQGENRRAAWQYLVMSRVLARRGKFDQATEYVQEAVALDPRNAEASDILEALQRGLPLPDGPTARLQPDAEGKRTLDSFVVFEDIEVKGMTLLDEADRVSPADLVLKRSLAQMADALFSDDVDPRMMQTYILLGQAADLQTRGFSDEALDAYLKAIEMGADTPAVHFNMGLLYWEKQDFARAIENLRHALSDPELALGANFAIGECYHDWGKAADALQYLLKVLEFLDSRTVPADQAEELSTAYERLYREYATQDGLKGGQLFARSIIEFLSGKGWSERIIQTRKQLDGLAEKGILIALGEILVEPKAQEAMGAMAQIQAYAERGMLFTALEECFWAVQEAPYCLPLHLCLAGLLIREDRIQEAVQKQVTVAEVYRVRGNLQRAINVYRQALDIAPMDVGVRQRLIDILLDAKQIDQVIEQYIALADTYYQLAQVDHAVEQYEKALRHAAQGDPSRHWETSILHRIGDIHTQRVDWRQAIKVYQRIKRIDPEDEKVPVQLIDLFFKVGQRTQALREVDDLIEFYKANRQPRILLSVLQNVVNVRPREVGLHMRLAKMYLDMRMKREAVAELDAVGEIQLEAGKTRDAIRTLQAIIRLEPDNVQQYRQLLAQISRQ